MISSFVLEQLENRRLLADARQVFDFDGGWKFIRQDVPDASAKVFDDSSWQPVQLPHTFNGADAQDGGDNYYRGDAWYRRRWRAPEALAGRQMYLRFEAVGQHAELWINGARVGEHRGGYSAFVFDMNPYIKIARANYIALNVSNALDDDIAPVEDDWNVSGGITRGVSIIATDTAHIDPLDMGSPGVYVRQSNVSSARADLDIDTLLRNTGGKRRKFDVLATLIDAAGNAVESSTSRVLLDRKSTMTVSQSIDLTNPHLWDGVRDPYLYTLRVELRNTENTLLDSATQKIGIRSFSVSPTSGLTLNGTYYDLHGVAFHPDRPGKGPAVSGVERKQDIDLALELGSTGVRLPHYQHDQYTYDLADEKGLIVWAEIPVYGRISTSAGFADSAKQQLRELIRQNFNHPAILFWALGNELDNDAPSRNLLTQLRQVAEAEDPSRMNTYASNLTDREINYMAQLTALNRYDGWYSGEVDYFGAALNNVHNARPNVAIGLSEYGVGASINHHVNDPNPTRPASTNNPFHPEEYLNVFHEKAWSQIAGKKWLWAKFVWSLTDFASDRRHEGEFNGRVDKGLVTFDRQTKKDAFFYYKANWTSAPVLYITSRRYTDRTDASTQVKVYSNLSAVELRVNGQLISTNTNRSFSVFKWPDITLQPGDNVIEVEGARGGMTYTDRVTWTYTPNGGRASAASSPTVWAARRRAIDQLEDSAAKLPA